MSALLATVHTCTGGVLCSAASTITTIVVIVAVVGGAVTIIQGMVAKARPKPKCQAPGCHYNADQYRGPSLYCWTHQREFAVKRGKNGAS